MSSNWIINFPSSLRLLILSWVFSFSCDIASAQNLHELLIDPVKVVGHEECARCHLAEVATWKQTPHSLTFEELHRKPEAQQIAERMGERSIKRGKLCIQCHYTEQQSGSRTKAVSGISCESCHGPAQDWISLHNDFGGAGASRESETEAHQKERLDTCLRLGMRNPENLYLVARSCFNCHTVPQEKLVNVGGHKAGSSDFELVAWSQGLVRHNFLRSNGANNQASAQARLRVMYVVGLLTDLEYSLRSLGNATEFNQFALSNALRIARLRKRVQKVKDAIDHPTFQQAWTIATTVELKLGNEQALREAADQLAALTHEFAQGESGESLEAIDPLLPTPDQYK
ncbi:Cytochrome c-554 precursor [Polystyrenella longa]|uniref:Cytochrome c-554 n=1 Tax=Polystyrenella longa TaxID=2528007 RepID=A0A518CMZ6_9PLAN|nr:cytochrome c family protein [Polystyrenella longa]QDU80574.1 Cytochrome c-554 precursor [Polystyrenella longa]